MRAYGRREPSVWRDGSRGKKSPLLVLLALAACTTTAPPVSAPAPEPYPDTLNPEGSPWGEPPDPLREPDMVVTPWGVTMVHTRGYPQVSLERIEDVLYEVADACDPDPGAFHLQIQIEPTLFQVDESWAAGVTEGDRIWVVGHYEAWDGRMARYDEALRRELIEHLLHCSDP